MSGPGDLSPPPTPADDIARLADDVLARPEFRPEPESLWERAVGWLADRLADVVGAFTAGGRSTALALVVLAALLAAAVYVASRLARARRSVTGTGVPVVVAAHRPRRPDEWDREADEHASAGRWREALRCRYRALVARLSAVGAVDDVPGRTAGEHRRALQRTSPPAAPAFEEATDLFERAWYGRADVEAREAERFGALAADVLERATG